MSALPLLKVASDFFAMERHMKAVGCVKGMPSIHDMKEFANSVTELKKSCAEANITFPTEMFK